MAVQLCTGWFMLVSKSTKVAVSVQSGNLHPGIQAVIRQCQKQYPHECLLKDTEFPSGYSLTNKNKLGFNEAISFWWFSLELRLGAIAVLAILFYLPTRQNHKTNVLKCIKSTTALASSMKCSWLPRKQSSSIYVPLSNVAWFFAFLQTAAFQMKLNKWKSNILSWETSCEK